MSDPELVITSRPTPDDVQYLEDRIYEFNSAATGITGGEWLAIFVKDEGRIIAGICGSTWGGCAVVDDHPHGHQNWLLRKRLGESS